MKSSGNQSRTPDMPSGQNLSVVYTYITKRATFQRVKYNVYSIKNYNLISQNRRI